MIGRLIVFGVLVFCGHQLCVGEPVKTEWGRIVTLDDPALRELEVEKWPKDGVLPLPTPFPNILMAWVSGKEGVKLLRWSFNQDATEIKVLEPDGAEAAAPNTVTLLTAESSGRLANGVIVFSALDANVVGEKAKLETHPGNHRIGFWANGADFVTWDVEVGKAGGKYSVWLVYSRAGGEGAEAEVVVGENRLPVRLLPTGSWYEYQAQLIGRVEFVHEGRLHMEVKSTLQKGPVMNLKAVVLMRSD